MPPPTLTPAQRAAGRAKSAQAATARAHARARLQAGELDPIDVLCAPREAPTGALRVEQLLVCLPGIGKVRAAGLVAAAGIPPNRRVRSLGARQQQALAEVLPPNARPAPAPDEPAVISSVSETRDSRQQAAKGELARTLSPSASL